MPFFRTMRPAILIGCQRSPDCAKFADWRGFAYFSASPWENAHPSLDTTPKIDKISIDLSSA
jgi:hypothetical protein